MRVSHLSSDEGGRVFIDQLDSPRSHAHHPYLGPPATVARSKFIPAQAGRGKRVKSVWNLMNC